MVTQNKIKDPAIYALHAGDGRYAYVGSTSQNSITRLWEHISRARSGHSAPVYEWMREVGLENVEVVDIAKVLDPTVREAIEAAAIAHFIAQGHPLRNQIARDGVPGSMSEASRRRIGDKARGRPTWIAGKTGEAAGWTIERRAAQAELIRSRNTS